MKTFKEYISEGAKPNISCFDLDDCLVFTKSRIYYTEPDSIEKSVGTTEFAKMRTKLHPDTKYDFRDFKELRSTYVAITKGDPNIKVLQYLDRAIAKGDKIAVLTARGGQSAVLAAIKDKILFKDSDGNFKKMPRTVFKKKFLFAVGDPATQKALGVRGGSENPSQLKAYVLQTILGDKMGFKSITFYDDDAYNIKAVKDLKDPRIRAIKV